MGVWELRAHVLLYVPVCLGVGRVCVHACLSPCTCVCVHICVPCLAAHAEYVCIHAYTPAQLVPLHSFREPQIPKLLFRHQH